MKKNKLILEKSNGKKIKKNVLICSPSDDETIGCGVQLQGTFSRR